MSFKQFNAFFMLAVAISSFTVGAEVAVAQTLYGSAGSLQTRENAHNTDWAYNWGIEPTNNAFSVDVANYEFVPMIWSASTSGVPAQINRILALENNFGVHVDYVLGFNEPELPTQSNMTVQTALNVWEIMTDEFSSTDIKLVSPAVSGNGGINDWLIPFMDEVEDRNADSDPNNDLQVDVIAYHFYTVAFNAQAEADKLIAQIDDLWERYQRPIWITEFAGTSFSATNPVHSTEERQEFNRDFLKALIPMFDARPYVERVSWWQFGASFDGSYSRLSTVSGGVYTPSIIGEVYFRTTLDAGQTYNFANRDFRPSYVHYLKGSHLSNTGSALPVALRAVDVMEGATNLTGTGDFGFELDDDAYVRVRSGATLRKQGTNTVTVASSPIFNDGEMELQGGTLQFEDGVVLSGSGSLRVDSNGTLATSGGIGGEDVALETPTITMNRGLLHVKDGVTTISEELRFSNPSEIRTDGNLVVSGFTGGAGSILATGPGTLFLSGDGTHSAGSQVSEGKLVVANSQVSATGPGPVLVAGTGTFGGFGIVDGDVVVSSGAVAPGIVETVSGDTATAQPDLNVLVDAIDFDFTGVQDDAPLTQTSTLSSGIHLVSGLDFGSGVVPRGVSNNGNEFNVAGFRTDTDTVTAANNGDYLTFTIAPTKGLAMIIEDVTFSLRRNGAAAATRYTTLTSIDGFTWPDRWGTILLDSADTSTQLFTASNPGTTPVTDEVEIRIVGVGASSGAGNTHFYAASVDASFVSDPSGVPLDPTGVLELGGSYTQLGFGTLEIDLEGTQAGEFDQLQVDGNVILSGTLDVSLINGFQPTAGQTFDIITANSVIGAFSNVIAPAGTNVQVNYSNSAVTLSVTSGDVLLGDVNLDSNVDFLDLAPFISLLSSGGFQAEADIDESGIVDFLDLAPFISLLSSGA